MKENGGTITSEVGLDLLVPPHVLPILMELIGGERQLAALQQEQLLAHLAMCDYCRTAVVFLLNVAQEYDHRNNNHKEPTRDLLMRFATICREIEAHEAYEAHEFERMGAYAEAIVAEGRERAAYLFPDVATHLRICSDCCSVLEAIVVSLTELDEIG